MAYQGKFRPKHPQKYKGDPSNIIYRSLWEFKLMRYLDKHPEISQWASEEHIIPYRSPIDGRKHRYFPDFWIKKSDGSCSLIEVKPSAQTKPPVGITKNMKPTRSQLNEIMTYGINKAKWEAAQKYCTQKGWSFLIMTEKELGIK